MEQETATSVEMDPKGQTEESQEADLVIDEADYELDEQRSDSGLSNNLEDSGIDAGMETNTHTIQPNFSNGDSALIENVKEEPQMKSAKQRWGHFSQQEEVTCHTKEEMIKEGIIREDPLRGIMCTLCGYEGGWRGWTRIQGGNSNENFKFW